MTTQNKPSNPKTYKPSKWQINTLTFLLTILIPILLDPSSMHLNIYIITIATAT